MFPTLTIFILLLSKISATPRGINLQASHLYKPKNGKFQCIQSGELINFSDLNDDYCDCADGSDEPGTSACSHLSSKPNTLIGFWCRNHGHISETISPTLVDDGICDCCDGSDELHKKCQNVCQQVGAVEREKRKQKIEMANAGFNKKVQFAKEAKEKFDHANAEINGLEQEMQVLDKEKQEFLKIKNELLENEKVEKRRCLDIEKARVEKVKQEKEMNRKMTMFMTLDLNHDEIISAEEILKFSFLNPDLSPTDLTSDEEQKVNSEFTLNGAKLILGDQDAVNFDTFLENVFDLISEYFDEEGYLTAEHMATFESENPEYFPKEESTMEPPIDGIVDDEKVDKNDESAENNVENKNEKMTDGLDLGHEEDDEQNQDSDDDNDSDDFDSDHDDSDHDDDEDDFSDDEDNYEEDYRENYDDDDYDYDTKNFDSKPSEQIIDGVEIHDQVWDEAAKSAMEAAKQAKEKMANLDKQVNDLKQKIGKFERITTFDFGPDGVFMPLDGTCVDLKTSEYIYELCFFKETSQKQLSGSSKTILGHWKNSEFEDDKLTVEGSWSSNYKIQNYAGGVRCWNGPDRSCKVVFTCGTETKLIEASEPQRCEYQFNVETPVVCDQVLAEHDEL